MSLIFQSATLHHEFNAARVFNVSPSIWISLCNKVEEVGTTRLASELRPKADVNQVWVKYLRKKVACQRPEFWLSSLQVEADIHHSTLVTSPPDYNKNRSPTGWCLGTRENLVLFQEAVMKSLGCKEEYQSPFVMMLARIIFLVFKTD